jgi:hypothetical protein
MIKKAIRTNYRHGGPVTPSTEWSDEGFVRSPAVGQIKMGRWCVVVS